MSFSAKAAILARGASLDFLDNISKTLKIYEDKSENNCGIYFRCARKGPIAAPPRRRPGASCETAPSLFERLRAADYGLAPLRRLWHGLSRRKVLRCSSSVVEHSLGKGEVESSILSCSTTQFARAGRPNAPAPPEDGTTHEVQGRLGLLAHFLALSFSFTLFPSKCLLNGVAFHCGEPWHLSFIPARRLAWTRYFRP